MTYPESPRPGTEASGGPIRHGGLRFNIWGAFFVVGGLWWLLGSLGLVAFQWQWLGPLALIAVGVSMLVGRGWGCGCDFHVNRTRSPP